MRISDWSSDVCSSDLGAVHALAQGPGNTGARTRRHGAPGRGRSVSEEQRLYGINAVRAAFARRPQALRKLYLAEARIPQLQPLLKWCVANRIGYRVVAEDDLRKLASSRSEEHTSELQSLMRISYAVFCLKKKKNT